MLLAGLAFWFWPRTRPHLLLITLDTTRADRLKCYGYEPARTPVLDALASEGVLCERAYTVAPLTLPAHASLFTGLYPVETGVITNGRGRMDDSLPTLAESLKRRGYETAAFVASFVLDRKFGLARGFTAYDDDIAGEEPDADALHRHRNGAEVVDAALAWLRQPRSRPFFCWVHLYDPHFPYLAHTDLFGDEFTERPYDAEIAYVDQQVGRLVAFLKERGLEGQTLIVVVGDHGEGLGEHFEFAHGMTLYNATMQVPLIFRYPTKLPAAGRVGMNVSTVDVSPTVHELLGLPAPPNITGRSFRSALAGGTVPASLCYGATDEPFRGSGWSPLRSLIDGEWKYIRTTRVELYDLANDPRELHNLAELDPGKMQAMESRLATFESHLVARAEAAVLLSASERRALESFGYVVGPVGVAVGSASANLPDIKDMLPLDRVVEEANDLVARGSADEGIEKLRDVVGQAPSHTKANWLLAWALWENSQADDGMRVFQALAELRPDCRDAHSGLGLMLLLRGETAAGISELTQALAIDPEFPDTSFLLAKAHHSSGRSEEALEYLNSVIELDPRQPGAHQFRAQVLTHLRRLGEAIADYRTALKYAPESADAHYNLGAALIESGDLDEALQHLTRAVELAPQKAELQYALGELLVHRLRHDEAIKHLARALELKPDFARAKEALDAVREALARRRPASE
jgi:arylsulfatase A-like enzyme/Flp pilus assembly protein TadD